MTINITIDTIFSALLISLIVLTVITVFQALYYRRLAVQMRWRVAVAERISKQMKKMKKEYKLTQRQKDFLNLVLDSSHSSKIVRQLLRTISQDRGKEKHNKVEKPSQMRKDLGIKNDKLLKDIVFLSFLCMLHASTHSFFFGFRFRKKLFNFIDSIEHVENFTEVATKDLSVIKKIVNRKNNLSGGEILSFIDNKFFDGRQTA